MVQNYENDETNNKQIDTLGNDIGNISNEKSVQENELSATDELIESSESSELAETSETSEISETGEINELIETDETNYENEAQANTYRKLMITEKEDTGKPERKKMFKVVSLSVAAVMAVQALILIIVVAGIGILKPDLFSNIGMIFTGVTYQSASSGKAMLTANASIRDIVVEQSQSPIVAIAEKNGPSVVGIKVAAKIANSWPFGASESSPEGSGIIIRKDGYIMTNNHVIEDAVNPRTNKLAAGSKIEVILPQQKDKPYEATIVGRDEKTDLAVLKIELNDLPAIEMGNSDELKVGELVVAIGNPGGLEYMGSVTAGIVSGLNRTIPVEDGKELKLIQTDAAINPGNSGGALVNSKGQLIGINTAKIGGQGFEGLGFAIPVNKAMEVTMSLIEFKYVKGRALFGIVADPRFTEDLASDYGVPMGVLVSEVTPFTGAYDAGIQQRDIITKFAGKAIKSVDELNEIKSKYKPGDKVEVEIYRAENYKTVSVKLTEDKR